MARPTDTNLPPADAPRTSDAGHRADADDHPGPVSDADLRSLPKIELHVHLEGSIRAGTARRMAHRHDLDPDAVLPLEDGAYPRRYRTFQHFAETFLAVSRQLQDPADLRTVAAEFARQQADQHVLYTEAHFTAGTHVDNGIAPGRLWAAVADGLAEVDDAEVRLIVDTRRELGDGHAARTVELVEAAPDGLVVALGLSGVEDARPAGAFSRLRRAADRLGLGLTVHAGETGGPDNVRAAVEDLGADRVGHGIAVTRDAGLCERMAAAGVVFEVCPSSNAALGAVATLDDHPVPAMLGAGLPVVIGSDDPPFFRTTLTAELGHTARLAGLGPSELAGLQRSAARAAFTGPERRRALLAAVDDWAAGSRPHGPQG